MDPVSCNQGHLNDPYPENGMCVVCGNFLKGNRHRMDSKKAAELDELKKTGTKAHSETARKIVEDEGFKWEEVTQTIRLLVENYVKRGNLKEMELALQQMGKLKAKPKQAEDVDETIIEVHVSDAVLESLDVLSRD